MTAICTVSGPLIDPTGALLINTPVTFVRVQEVGGTGTATVIGRDVTAESDALGEIEVDLLAGQYRAVVNGTRGMFQFAVGVPDAATAALHDCIEQFPVITPGLVQQAVDARDGAQEILDRIDLGALDAAVLQTGEDRDQTALDRDATEADRLLAQSARAAAEAARDSTFANGGRVATSVAAGLALSTDGQQFAVVEGDWVQLYTRTNSTTAAIIPGARYPTSAALDPLQGSRAILVVSDADGNEAVDISVPLTVSGAGINTPQLGLLAGGKWALAVSDSDGNVVFGVDRLGNVVGNISAASAPSAAGAGIYDATVNHIFCYGQSLSVGQAMPVQSGTAAYDHLMFTRGMRPQYDYPAETAAQWYAGLVPAVEIASPNPSWSSALGETPSRGTGDMVKQLIASEDGKAFTDHEYRLLLSNPGFGATTIAQLSKGSTHYARMVEQAQHGMALANAAGDTYAVQAVTWIQGESDYLSGTTGAAYLAALNTLIADINTDLRAVTGQSKRVAVIGYQVASHIHGAADDAPDIAQAQLDCAETNPNFYIATPMYHLPYADGFHLTGVGSRWLGAYLGLAYKRIVIDGREWRPVRPVSHVRQGRVAELRFSVPAGRLVLDTVSVAAQTNMGFQIVDSSGSALTISAVEIVDFDRVRITAAATIPTGARLRYGWQGDAARGLGNLRDTQGDAIKFDPAGANLPLHNWCCIFERSL